MDDVLKGAFDLAVVGILALVWIAFALDLLLPRRGVLESVGKQLSDAQSKALYGVLAVPVVYVTASGLFFVADKFQNDRVVPRAPTVAVAWKSLGDFWARRNFTDENLRVQVYTDLDYALLLDRSVFPVEYDPHRAAIRDWRASRKAWKESGYSLLYTSASGKPFDTVASHVKRLYDHQKFALLRDEASAGVLKPLRDHVVTQRGAALNALFLLLVCVVGMLVLIGKVGYFSLREGTRQPDAPPSAAPGALGPITVTVAPPGASPGGEGVEAAPVAVLAPVIARPARERRRVAISPAQVRSAAARYLSGPEQQRLRYYLVAALGSVVVWSFCTVALQNAEKEYDKHVLGLYSSLCPAERTGAAASPLCGLPAR